MSVIAEKLRAALELMNDGGKHWAKGSYRTINEDEEYSFCAVGAIQQVTPFYSMRSERDECLVALNEQLPPAYRDYYDEPWKNIVTWNDESGRTWDQVVDVFTRAADAVA